jgi:hypothetical protein
MLIPKTDRNPNLFLPAQIQPSPVEMEHVSTTPDIATNPDPTSHRSTGFDPFRTNRPFTVSPLVFHALRQISRLDS